MSDKFGLKVKEKISSISCQEVESNRLILEYSKAEETIFESCLSQPRISHPAVKTAHTMREGMHKCLENKAPKTGFLRCSTVIKSVLEYFGLCFIMV